MATDSLTPVFAALSDPTRRAIVQRLASGRLSASALAHPFSMSLPALLKHLKVLQSAGLIVTSKEGRVRWCDLNPTPMKHASEWLGLFSRVWDQQLDALGAYLEEEKRKEAP